MAGKRLRALVRVREAVATSQLAQLKRPQDDEDVRQQFSTDADKSSRPSPKPAKARKAKAKAKAKAKRTPAREARHFRTIVREAGVSKTGRAYEATILREGPGNPQDRNAYSREALRKAVSDGLFEGLQCYLNHPTVSEERERPERDVRQLAGHFREARFVDGQPAEVRAKFVPIEGPGYEFVTSLIESALGAPEGRPLIGISIDGYGHAPDAEEIDGRKYNIVREVTHLGSADIVTRAGAGGKFHRRLSESLAGARATVTGGPELTPARLQKRLGKALERLQTGLADEDEDLVREAFVTLHEAASASVRLPVMPAPAGDDLSSGEVDAAAAATIRKLQERMRKERKRRRAIESRADTLDRAKTAGRLLREVDVPADTAQLWFDELVERPNEAAMRTLLERRQAERRNQLGELRESLGLDRVEGAGPRQPSTPTTPAGSGLLERMGINPDDCNLREKR